MAHPKRFDRTDPKKDATRVNERIRVREIRLIGSDGEQLGVMPPEEAMEKAREEGLDLVEVAPNASPPVCRIMDYGRYKYEQKKKAGKGKAKGHAASLKEMKLRPRTDQHDLEFKLKKVQDFLIEGDKVKITIMFRGREIVHRELGYQQLDVVKKLLGNLAEVENPPRMEGRFLSMILVPNREGVAEARKAREAEEKREAGEQAAAQGDGEDKGAKGNGKGKDAPDAESAEAPVEEAEAAP